MRVDVKKYLFVGPMEEKESFFKTAQDAGLIQFIPPEKGASTEVPQEIQNILAAIKILRGFPVLEQEEFDKTNEADRLSSEILEYHTQLDRCQEEKRVADLELSRIEVFGDFSLEDLSYIKDKGHRIVQFYFAKQGMFQGEELPENLFWVAADHGLDYFVGVHQEPRKYENMIEMVFHDTYGALLQRSKRLETRISELSSKLKAYEKYNQFLHKALTQKLNEHYRNSAAGYILPVIDDRIFVVAGWVPKNKSKEMESWIADSSIQAEEIAIEERDDIPTYLENRGAGRIGEDLVHIYDTPSIEDKDPSLWVLISFALFFALIISDGGYGLIFLATALYIRWNTKKITYTGKRALRLAMILSASCVLWGLATNSFFGIQFSQDNPIKKYSPLFWLAEKKAEYHIQNQDATLQEWVKKYPDLQGVTDPDEFFRIGSKEVNGKSVSEVLDKFSDNIMMELALLIGMVHIALSFARYLERHWAGLGWIFVIIGGYLYIPEYLQATSILHFVFGLDKTFAAQEGLYMMMGGLGLAVILSLIQHRLAGLLEITNVIQVFADILSYLRLYALGLAGSIISATVNDIAGSVFIFLGVILVIIGHIVNMVLSIIGGVIHGLRLNFIEWYHYSFEGGGKPFTPLQRLDKE